MMMPTTAPRTGRSPRTLMGFALGAAVLLAGCSGAEQTAQADDAEAAALPAAEGTTTYPLELHTPFGSTTLEQRPARIAVISPATVDTDVLAALGVAPVYAPDTVELEPWVPEEIIGDVETYWNADVGELPDAEEVLAAEPDLIVSLQAPETFGSEQFDRYSQIAPLLVSDPSGPPQAWAEITAQLGEVLDLAERAQALIGEVDAEVDGIAERHPEYERRTAAHVHVYGQDSGAAYFSFPGSDSAALLERLGFSLPEKAAAFTQEQNTISEELIGDIDADVLLVTVTPTGGGAGWFTDSTMFQQVPAVEEGRVAIYEPAPDETFAAFAWAIRMQSPLSLPWAANTLEELADEAIG